MKVAGVEFAKEADAKAFLEKAKGNGATLEKLAKDANVGDKFRDFKLVNAQALVSMPYCAIRFLPLRSSLLLKY